MAWNVSLLPDADQDLHDLTHDQKWRDTLEGAILAEFQGPKGERVTKLFKQGVSTSSIDRLAGSTFPGSIRVHVRADYRATVLCLPAFQQAYVTHVFHKSQDPKYRRAVATHDARAGQFVETFSRFLSRRK